MKNYIHYNYNNSICHKTSTKLEHHEFNVYYNQIIN